MITITQFSNVQLKAAKAFLAKTVQQAPAPVSEAAPAEEGAPVNAAEAPAPAGPRVPASTGPSAEQLAALATEFKCDETKAALLAAAVGVAGNRIDRLRMVRVVKAEGAPSNAVKVGEAGYILDMITPTASASSDRGGSKRDGGRRDGGRGGDRRGGGGGPGRGDNRGGGRGDSKGGKPPVGGSATPRG